MLAGEELADRYVLAERLGSGGMGEVWRAVDRRDGGAVAVKVLRLRWATAGQRDRALARFRREIAVTARLDSTRIVKVLDSGEHDGRPFMVLELVEGENLTALLSRRPQGLHVGQALGIALQIAVGLDGAHRHGVVHRDIKPSNVLVLPGGAFTPGSAADRDSEPAAGSFLEVRICDFGVAWLNGATAGLTATGTRLGTLAYTAPELLERGGAPDGRADLYSLGCTLFELLTGRVPFPADTATAVMAMHLTAPPPSARAIRADVPDILDRYLRRLLAKDPADRPGPALNVAAHLHLISGLLDVDTGSAPGPGTTAGPGLDRELERVLGVDLGPDPEHALGVAGRDPGPRPLALLDTWAGSAAFSSDGAVLVTGGFDGVLRWDTGTWRAATPREAPGYPGAGVQSVAFGADGALFASARGNVHDPAVWPGDRRGLGRRLRGALRTSREEIRALAVGPDGTRLAVMSDRAVRLWDIGERRRIATLTGHRQGVRAVAFSPDGRLLVSGGFEVLRLWSAGTGEPAAARADLAANALAFHPDGGPLAVGGFDGRIRLWDHRARVPVGVLDGHTNWVSALAFSPGGPLLASGSWDHTVRLWDWASRRCTAVLTGHTAHVETLAFSPDGTTLVSAGVNEAVLVWRIDPR